MRTQFTASRYLGAASRPDPASGSTRLKIRKLNVCASAYGAVEAELDKLETELKELVAELDGRILDDMMLGATTTLHGIAAWVMERLALTIPRLLRVEVAEEGRRVSVERDTR